MKRKVCLIWHNVYPWDIRIEKFLRSLAATDYDVTVICRGREGYRKEETVANAIIYRISPPDWMKKNMVTFPLFFNPIWTRSLKEILSRVQPELVIVRDIPIAMPVSRLCKKMGIPSMLDMAENYPAALQSYNNVYYKPFLVKNAFLPRYYERACLKLMSHIVVVSDEQKERLVSMGIEQARLSVVMNTPDLDRYETLTEAPEGSARSSESLHKLIYVGMVDAHRGVDVLIEGLSLALKTVRNLSLKIIGSGGELNRVRKLAEELDAHRHVEFTNWIPFESVPWHIKSSDIGIIPHLKSEHTDTTIPNKLFDYMAFGKPVISSDLYPVARIINETGCGSVFESGNPEDLAQKIIDMTTHNTMGLMGEKGRSAVQTRYNWKNDERHLLETIGQLLKEK